MWWPDTAGPYAGDCWAIEAELIPKQLDRVASIMTGLLARDADWSPGSMPCGPQRFDQVIYLCSRAARPVTEQAAAQAPGQRRRLLVRDLPGGALR